MTVEPPARTQREREAEQARRAAARTGRDGGGGYDDGQPPPRGVVEPPSHARRRIVLAVVLVLAIALVWFLVALFQPFKGEGHGSVEVAIPRGSGVGEIADLLEKRGVVSSGFLFEVRATLAGRRGDLKPGPYVLKRDMSYGVRFTCRADRRLTFANSALNALSCFATTVSTAPRRRSS